jgi:transcriptional regulator with XRE-family HTH domain
MIRILETLAWYGLSQSQLANAVGISPNRIAEIGNNRRRITAHTARRLGLYFGNRWRSGTCTNAESRPLSRQQICSATATAPHLDSTPRAAVMIIH